MNLGLQHNNVATSREMLEVFSTHTSSELLAFEYGDVLIRFDRRCFCISGRLACADDTNAPRSPVQDVFRCARDIAWRVDFSRQLRADLATNLSVKGSFGGPIMGPSNWHG